MSRKVDYPVSDIGAEAPFTPARLKVLVADDNEINRYLVSHLLREKGHDVVLVVDGLEAVQAAAAEEFDLVLMDLQMPEMDGIEATAEIRKLEKVSRQPRIFALTANVMTVGRDRCLELGFDAYVSKPIRPKQLFEAIETVLTDRREQTPFNDSSESLVCQSDDQLDRDTLVASVNGNGVLLSKIVQLFLKHYPKVLVDLRHAIETNDAVSLARIAHSLKGGSGTLLTASALNTIVKLEELAKTGLTSISEPVLAHLEELLNQNAELLTELVSSMKK